MADIVMPRLSDTMEEGTILRWLKSNGEEVARGEELVEIETDKATMTYESDQAGVLQILVAAGDTLAVGQVIARVGTAAPGTHDDARGARVDENDDEESGVRSEQRQAAGSAAQAAAPARALGVPAGGGEAEAAGARVKASPLARRVARESGVDLRSLAGSGPGGRIVKADVEAAPASERTQGQTLEGVMTAKGETSIVELTRTQQAVARRMAESKATIPDFTLQIDVDMEACVTLRTQLKQLATPQGAGEPQPDAPATRAHDVPTYNDMVVKAAALALREHPRANGSYRDGQLQLYARVNVGVAVAAEGALVVPTVFDADEKSLGEIAREARALAERVRAGTITPPELGGGTFTVSNLGMYGVRSFTAIINPPQAGILSVGALAQRAVAHEGEVALRHTMTLTLACDHRILYGAEAALFLARIRDLLQAPAALTL